MTTEKSVSRFKNWLLAGCVVIICYLAWQLRKSEQQSFIASDKIEQLTGEKAVLEHEITTNKKLASFLQEQKVIETNNLEKELQQYKSLPVKQKIKLVEVFKPVLTNDSLVCFDQVGIDSINTLAITHKSVLRQLKLSDSVIVVQQEIITSDSLLIAKEQETSSIWKGESQSQKVNADKQGRKAKIWKSVAIVASVVAGVTTLILLR